MSGEPGPGEDAPAAFYLGSVMHARLRPRAHRFRYRAFMTLVDLDAFAGSKRLSRLFSLDRFNLMSLRERDHLPDEPGASLRERARGAFARRGIDVSGARLRLLAMPRVLGYAFNPIAIFYAADENGALRAVLYEVRNTFGERRVYAAGAKGGAPLGPHEIDKDFHVSPFLPMALRYRFRTRVPEASAALKIVERDADGVVLTAIFAGERLPLSDGNVVRLFFSLPLMTLKVILAIHWEALRLLGKGLKIHPHPSRGRRRGAEEPAARSGS